MASTARPEVTVPSRVICSRQTTVESFVVGDRPQATREQPNDHKRLANPLGTPHQPPRRRPKWRQGRLTTANGHNATSWPGTAGQPTTPKRCTPGPLQPPKHVAAPTSSTKPAYRLVSALPPVPAPAGPPVARPVALPVVRTAIAEPPVRSETSARPSPEIVRSRAETPRESSSPAGSDRSPRRPTGQGGNGATGLQHHMNTHRHLGP